MVAGPGEGGDRLSPATAGLRLSMQAPVDRARPSGREKGIGLREGPVAEKAAMGRRAARDGPSARGVGSDRSALPWPAAGAPQSRKAEGGASALAAAISASVSASPAALPRWGSAAFLDGPGTVLSSSTLAPRARDHRRWRGQGSRDRPRARGKMLAQGWRQAAAGARWKASPWPGPCRIGPRPRITT